VGLNTLARLLRNVGEERFDVILSAWSRVEPDAPGVREVREQRVSQQSSKADPAGTSDNEDQDPQGLGGGRAAGVLL